MSGLQTLGRVAAYPPILGLLVACSSAEAQPPPPSPIERGDAGPSGRMEVPTVLPDVGSACLPVSETSPGYAGANVDTPALDTDARCTQACLVYHFQGRVSCPYGQNENQLQSLPADDIARCRVPDASGEITEQPVEVPVSPQLVGRPDEQAVYCSCRCDGPDPDASYCACPQDMDCLELFAPTGDAATDSYAGSYCVKRDAVYDPDASYGDPCIHGDPEAQQPCGDGNP